MLRVVMEYIFMYYNFVPRKSGAVNQQWIGSDINTRTLAKPDPNAATHLQCCTEKRE
jgi:hypothetical protein